MAIVKEPSTSEKISTVVPIFSRRGAWIQMAGSFAMSAIGLLGDPPPIIYASSAFFFLCGLPGLVALLFPDRAKTGITLIDGGFEHFRGLRGSQTIRLTDIRRIYGVATGNGEDGDPVYLVVHTEDQTARLQEADLFGTSLFARISTLPGFHLNRYHEAVQYKVQGWEHLGGKTFVLME